MAGVSTLLKYKLTVLGDESVGKTSIIIRFTYDKFDSTYQIQCLILQPTIGIDFLSKTVHLEDFAVRLQLWDTGGKERFRNLIPSYIADSSYIVIVYDVTNRKSYLNISTWIEDVRTKRGNDAVIVLVGNKTDLVDKRQVSTEEGDNQARKFGCMFVETSAKDGFNVRHVFFRIISNVREYMKPHDNPSPNLSNQQPSPQESQQTPPNRPQEQDIHPQHPQLAVPTPQASSTCESLEDIVKNLVITQQQYIQDTQASLKNLEKAIEQLVALVGKLEAKEWFPSQTEVNLT
ncbi:ras-related protein RABH1e [Lactuca sativa]|uniref:ras-related protein RABH1e n=1 Tax=Lactuca sativa TaxID=4236 RepID=UPI001C68B104|nr:ras-related protein RABH1e [Lactuca sativa]